MFMVVQSRRVVSLISSATEIISQPGEERLPISAEILREDQTRSNHRGIGGVRSVLTEAKVSRDFTTDWVLNELPVASRAKIEATLLIDIVANEITV